ncbi:hypothetical protein BH11ARM2_BH11ARM2_38730 [soil metagenome]
MENLEAAVHQFLHPRGVQPLGFLEPSPRRAQVASAERPSSLNATGSRIVGAIVQREQKHIVGRTVHQAVSPWCAHRVERLHDQRRQGIAGGARPSSSNGAAGRGRNGTRCGKGPGSSEPPSNCAPSLSRSTCSSKESNAGERATRPFLEQIWLGSQRSSRSRRPRRWRSSTIHLFRGNFPPIKPDINSRGRYCP